MAIKRRDFNRLVLAGAGISPIFARSSLAQMSPEEIVGADTSWAAAGAAKASGMRQATETAVR